MDNKVPKASNYRADSHSDKGTGPNDLLE